jgi:hypothetical protein
MLEVAGRADLKSDLLQELERQKHTLIGFKSNPNVQAEMLDKVLDDVDRVSSALIACTGKTGQNIRDNEWLMSIRGRTIIPGGACEFDLPSYHAWQKTRLKNDLPTLLPGLHRSPRYLMRSMWSYVFCGSPAQQAKSLRKPVVISRCYREKCINSCAST